MCERISSSPGPPRRGKRSPCTSGYSPAPRAACVVTIHNLAFQGVYPMTHAAALDLPAESLGLDGLEYYGQMSFLKGGLMHAQAITTVSPTYAREIQAESLGFGMDGILRQRSRGQKRHRRNRYEQSAHS